MYMLPRLPRLTGALHIDSVLVPPVYNLTTVILLLLFKYLLNLYYYIFFLNRIVG
jgi:hypothetical protein